MKTSSTGTYLNHRLPQESISEFIMDKARLKTLPPRCQGSVQRLMCSNGVKEALERLHAAEADSEVEAPESTTIKTDPTGTEGLMARPPPGKQEAAVADDGQLADTDGDGSGSMTGNGEGDSDDTDAGEQRSSDSRGGEDSDDSSDDDGEGEESDGVVEARAGLGAALKAALAAAQSRMSWSGPRTCVFFYAFRPANLYPIAKHFDQWICV